MGRVMASSVAILVALVMLAIIGGLVYSLFDWLFSKTSRDGEKPTLRHILLSFSIQLRPWLYRRTFKYQSARLYYALIKWGQSSRLPHSPSETPVEYGVRLKRRFPILEKQFVAIIDAFNREAYGEIILSKGQLEHAQFASHKLASPAYWSMRFRAWFQKQN
jgi:hypothetical protein